MVTITPLRASDTEAIGEMFTAHAAETMNVPPEQASRLVDWEWFESTDALFALVARDGDTPVGYCITQVQEDDAGVPEVIDADIYLKPAYRKGLNGVRLLRAMEARVHHAGVRTVHVTVLKGRPTEKLLPLLGYEVEAIRFRRDLGGLPVSC